MKSKYVNLVALVIAVVLAVAVYGNAMAGGDKVRGDKGAGAVNQYQVVPPWWAVP